MVVDSNGVLQLAYGDFSRGDELLVKHSVKTGSHWSTEAVDRITAPSPNSIITLLHDSLAVSSGNSLHASYVDPINQDLRYATVA